MIQNQKSPPTHPSVKTIRIQGTDYPCEEIISVLERFLTRDRKEKIEQVLRARSNHLQIALEKLYDDGNRFAVLRSFEGFGFLTAHHILGDGVRLKEINRKDRGSQKWLLNRYELQIEHTIKKAKQDGYRIRSTSLEARKRIEDLDWQKPSLVIFGNEHLGTSALAQSLSDECFQIPMFGFTQSFNISVAAALVFYHVRRVLERASPQMALREEDWLEAKAQYYANSVRFPERIMRRDLQKTV